MSRYIFNPQHDLCLAAGDADYIPPASALEFARKCSWVERFMGESPDATFAVGSGIVPWGWNAVLRDKLLREGIPANALPSDAQLEFIREHSRREVAVELLEYLASFSRGASPGRIGADGGVLSENGADGGALSENGADGEVVTGGGIAGNGKGVNEVRGIIPCGYRIVAKSLEEVERFLDERGKVVLKAPLSGSGKGIRFAAGELMDTDRGWCRRVLEKQGSVVVEERLEVLKEFAMLFWYSAATSGSIGVSFRGYSIFYSSNGAYKGNILASNSYMENMLQEYIPVDVLRVTRSGVESFLQEKLQGCGGLEGFVGVDQFVCRQGNGGEVLYNPAVEINLRMTMGHIARNIYDFHKDEFGLGEGTHCFEPIKGVFGI